MNRTKSLIVPKKDPKKAAQVVAAVLDVEMKLVEKQRKAAAKGKPANSCDGKCCERFSLPVSPQQLSLEYDNWYKGTQGARPMFDDIHLLAPMLVYLGLSTKDCNGGEGPPLHWYTCKHFDRANRLCTIYEIRPRTCRVTGTAHACSWEGCTNAPPTRKFDLVQLGVARHDTPDVILPVDRVNPQHWQQGLDVPRPDVKEIRRLAKQANPKITETQMKKVVKAIQNSPFMMDHLRNASKLAGLEKLVPAMKPRNAGKRAKLSARKLGEVAETLSEAKGIG